MIPECKSERRQDHPVFSFYEEINEKILLLEILWKT